MKKYIIAFLGILSLILIVYIYSRYIEPSMLNVHYENFRSELISDNDEKLVILQFSDTHISDNFRPDNLKNTVNKINNENPDIVVFTGDLFDKYSNYKNKREEKLICDILSSVKARIGKFAVYGNHDYGGGAEKIYKQIMDNSGFVLLVNECIKIEEYNINLIGLDDSIFGRLDKNKLINLLEEDCYNIVLSHEPDIIDYFLEYNIDLQLSGHSHGGQVNIPFVSSKILPALGSKYVRGLYQFENSRDTKLYVNIGLGTSQVPLRFMAIPELSVFTLEN